MSRPEDDSGSPRARPRRLADRLLDRTERPLPGRSVRAAERLGRATPAAPATPAPRVPAPPSPAPSRPFPAPSRPSPAPIAPPPPAQRPAPPAPVEDRSGVGRVRLGSPARVAPAPAPPSAEAVRAARLRQRPGTTSDVPRRTIDDYMQMLGELQLAERRYRAAIREAPPKGPPRRADESDDGG